MSVHFVHSRTGVSAKRLGDEASPAHDKEIVSLRSARNDEGQQVFQSTLGQ
jgi:hypothetical protein